MKAPLFLTRDVAVSWLQDQAIEQARRKYGPAVRTSIGQCPDIGTLCRYLGIRQSSVRWGRRVMPGAPVNDQEAAQ